MKQKLFFLALTLLFLSVTSMNAQVQIGGTAGPNVSAILDLNPDEGDATLGLKLPVIELGDVSLFQLSGTAEDADGITVYNSSDATIGGSGKGIYVWEEDKWVFAGKSGQTTPVAVPITRITVTEPNDATTVNYNGTLEFDVIIEPATPSNPDLVWSIVYNSAATAGDAIIVAPGKIKATKPGVVTVRAAATDGSGASGSYAFTVKATDYVTGISISSVDGKAYVNSGKTRQLQVAVVPNSGVQYATWSVVSGSESVSLNTTTGLVTGLIPGTAMIQATSGDGQVTSDPFEIEIRTADMAPTGTVTFEGTNYRTYDFNGTTWMIDNLALGTAAYHSWNNDPTKPTWYYYTYAQALVACPEGWHLPTIQNASDLLAYIDGPAIEDSEKNLIWDYSTWGASASGSTWWNFGGDMVLALEQADGGQAGPYLHITNTVHDIKYGSGTTYRNVRCVMD